MEGREELAELQKTIEKLSDTVSKTLKAADKTLEESGTPEEIEIAKKFAAKHYKLVKEGKLEEAEKLANKYRNG